MVLSSRTFTHLLSSHPQVNRAHLFPELEAVETLALVAVSFQKLLPSLVVE